MHTEPVNTAKRPGSYIPGRLIHRIRTLHIPAWIFDFSETLLMEVPPQLCSKESCTVRLAGLEDLPLLAACREMKNPEEGIALFMSRINSGCACYLLFEEASFLLGYAWVAETVNLFEDDDRVALSCSYDQAYIFDTFLHPSARGRGLYRTLIAHLQRDMALKGRQKFFVLVDHGNEISIRAHEKLGAVIVEDIRYTTLLGICRYSMKTRGRVRHSFRRFHSSRPCYSRTLAPQDPRRYSLVVQALNDEIAWQKATERLEACDLSGSDSDSPFNHPSVIRAWWEQDIRGKEELFLIEVIDTETSLTAAYGMFRLYTDTKRFGSPRTLSAFNDLYFMHNTLLARIKELQASDVIRFLSEGKQMQSIRKETSADVIIWHRLPAQQIPPLLPDPLSRWHTVFETSYPILDGAVTSSPMNSHFAHHTLRDLNKQAKRVRNRFAHEPQTSCFTLSSRDRQEQDALLERFYALFAISWQHQ